MIPLFFMFNENIFRNMANINKIRISGTSYDIQDLNAPGVSALTQQEYDNLPSSAKTSNTFFVITDAQAGDLTQYWTSAQTQSAITQATSGKANSSDVYLKSETSGATEISTAFNEKLSSVGSSSADWVGIGITNLLKTIDGSYNTAYAYVASINQKPILSSSYLNVNEFSLVETSAITTSVTSSSTDSQVPSAKAVNDKLGGLSLVKLTQVEYDAITTKDNNTLYVIT